MEFSLLLLGSMCAWLGFLRIAEESGLTRLFARCLSPVTGRLFPDYRDNQDIQGKICMNLSANLLGLGNAATPLGPGCCHRHGQGEQREAPTRGMILFVVMNTASLQLLPVNLAAMRSACGSAAPFAVLPEIWLTSLACLVTGGGVLQAGRAPPRPGGSPVSAEAAGGRRPAPVCGGHRGLWVFEKRGCVRRLPRRGERGPAHLPEACCPPSSAC